MKSEAQKDHAANYVFASSNDPGTIPSRHVTVCYSGVEADYVQFSAKRQIEFIYRYNDVYLRVINNAY